MEFDTYLDSAEGITINHDQAMAVIREHHLTDEVSDFYAEFGKVDSYNAHELLLWIGY